MIGGTFTLSALLAVAAVALGAEQIGGTQTTLAVAVAVAAGILAVVMLGGDRFEIL